MRNRWNRQVSRALRSSAKGMTLVEIMVVIAIIGILSTAIGFGVVNYLKSSKAKACKLQINKVAKSLTIYYADEGDYPDSLSDVQGIRENDLTDPWKNELRYNSSSTRGDGEEFDLCSDGPDKQQGTEDDICYEG